MSVQEDQEVTVEAKQQLEETHEKVENTEIVPEIPKPETEVLAVGDAKEQAEAAARAQLENDFAFDGEAADSDEELDEEGEEEEGDAVTELVSTTVKPLTMNTSASNAETGAINDDEVPELGPGEGFMLKDLNTGKMVHIVNDIDSFFDQINFTTFDRIKERAENAAKNLQKQRDAEAKPVTSDGADSETDEFLHYLPAGAAFTTQIRAHAFAMDHNRKIYCVYFVDVKLTQPDEDNKETNTKVEEEGVLSNDEQAPRSWTVFRRYNHFRSLMEKMKKAGYNIAGMPPKRLFKSNFDPNFLRERREQLEEWLNAALSLEVWLNDNSYLRLIIYFVSIPRFSQSFPCSW